VFCRNLRRKNEIVFLVGHRFFSFSHFIFSSVQPVRNGMGKEFTPKLAEFYKSCCKHDDNNMEIVFVSSDDTRNDFLETFADMPWLAIDGDADGARIKHKLATHLKVFRLPSLIILNVETGHFVTDHARQEVEALFEKENPKEQGMGTLNVQKGKELLQQWRTQEPERLGHADTLFNKIYLTLLFFQKNPIYIVGLAAFLIFTSTIRRVQQNPLLGMAMVYLLLTLGKEPLDKNIPYIVQEEKKQSATNPSDKKTA
jgi:Thioredoxin-like